MLSIGQITDDYWYRLDDNGANFKQITDTFDMHITNEYPDSIPFSVQPNINEYERFVYFWKSRLGINNGQTSYEPYKDAIINALNAPYCVTGDPSNWELVGPVSYSLQSLGLVRQVLHDPDNSGSYLLASDFGGIWKNQQTGNSWVNVTDNLRSPGLAISELIRDPNNHYHLLASTSSGLHSAGHKGGYGIGIIESFDNGNTWTVMQGLQVQNVKAVIKVLFDPSDNTGNTIFALTATKIFKSTNLGQTWFNFQPPALGQHEMFFDMEIANNGIIFVSTKHLYTAGAHAYRLVNGNWEDLSQNNSLTSFKYASFTKPHQSKVFISCTKEDPHETHIYKSLNNGNTWADIKIFYSGGNKPKSSIRYSPQSNIIYFSTVKLKYFKDDGTYTTHSLDANHSDIRDLDFMGIDAQGYEHLIIATDGGITRTIINKNDLSHGQVENLNGNYLPICEFVGFGIAHSSPEFIVAGAMHNQSFKYQNGSWYNFSGGDGGDCEVNWDAPSNYYFMTQGCQYSNDKPLYCSSLFIGKEYELNPDNPYIIYFGSAESVLGIYNETTNDDPEIKDVPSEIEKVGAIGVNTNNEIFIADFTMADNNTPNRFVKSTDGGDH